MSDLGPRPYLSYTPADRDVVWKLSGALRRRGLDPWVDIAEVRPGEDLKKARAAAYRKIRLRVLQSIESAIEVSDLESQAALDGAREAVTRLFSARTPFLAAQRAALEAALAQERDELEDH